MKDQMELGSRVTSSKPGHWNVSFGPVYTKLKNVQTNLQWQRAEQSSGYLERGRRKGPPRSFRKLPQVQYGCYPDHNSGCRGVSYSRAYQIFCLTECQLHFNKAFLKKAYTFAG